LKELIFLKEDWIVQGLTIPKGTIVLMENNKILEIDIDARFKP
jgi:hypothetical protein